MAFKLGDACIYMYFSMLSKLKASTCVYQLLTAIWLGSHFNVDSIYLMWQCQSLEGYLQAIKSLKLSIHSYMHQLILVKSNKTHSCLD